YRAKISGIDIPARATISSSASTNGQPSLWATRRPTVVLPAPMKPASTILVAKPPLHIVHRQVLQARAPQRLEARQHLVHAVAADLFQQRLRQNSRHPRLAYRHGAGNGTVVATLVGRLFRLARCQIDRR